MGAKTMNRRRAVLALLAGFGPALWAAPTVAFDRPLLEPIRTWEVRGSFAGKQEGRVAKDLSGITCQADSGAGRHCVVINDENRAAQAATLQPDGSILVGEPIRLIGEKVPTNIAGRRPAPPCPATGDFSDLDGEGAAEDGLHVYVTGSHGCSRHTGEFRLSAFLLARFKWSNPREVELTYRLSEALQAASRAGSYFGRDLMSANGLNVEGIAVLGDKLYAGLRAPSLDGHAFVVAVHVSDLFAPGDAPLTSASEVIELSLGSDAGIRDLARLPNGRLLVLSGPAQEQPDVPYGFTILSTADGRATPLGTLAPVLAPDGSPAKAEAAVPLQMSGDKLRVLVLFDGLPNGGPREYELALQ